MTPAGITVFILLFISPSLFAQEKNQDNRITLSGAVDTAFKNNLQLRSGDLQIESSRALAGAWRNIPRTGVFAENEDLAPQDKKGILKIGISQSLEWPGLYKAQRKLLQQQITSVELTRKMRELEIRRDVQLAYYQIWYLQSRQLLWKNLDSLFLSFEQAAILRVRTGESAGLDSISAKAKASEIAVQLSILQRDIQAQQEILKRILNTTAYYLPPLQALEKVTADFVIDSSGIHPQLQLQQQNIAIAEAEIGVQKQSGRPNFDGRFFSQRLYGVSNPYSGFSVSVGIPLFGRSFYRSKIRGAEIERNYQQALYDYEQLSFNTAHIQAIQQLQKDQELLNFYETRGLAQADAIIRAANLAYRGGEIGFSELSQFLTQAIDIQKNYLEVLNQYNQSAIQLNYFLNR